MDIEPLVLAHAERWREWLDANEDSSEGVWLLLAKKGTRTPTELGYDRALEEALCSGWIDGQRRGFDDTTFLQRFTPRRPGSNWSQRNVGIVQRLIEAGRMRARGHEEIDRARQDGRWDRAYPGPATATTPDDLTVALRHSPRAAARFDAMPAAQRYPLMLPILTAPPALRAKRIAGLVDRLAQD